MKHPKSKALQIIEKAMGEPIGISTLLKAHRTRLGYTQPQIASILGTSKSDISDIETKKKTISLERAVTFADKLNESTKVWTEVAIQDQLNKLGLNLVVKIKHKSA
jgi:transcriptional regulator with XRE-family HTH domain